MVQVLRAGPQRSRGFAESILGGIAENAPSAIQQYQQNKQQVSKMHQENEAAKRLGIDLTGISDPKMRQQAFQIAMQQRGKEDLLGKKQGFLENILGGNKQQNIGKNLSEDIQQEDKPNQLQQQGFDPLSISDADIARVAAQDPNLARELRYAKDASIKERREELRSAERKEMMTRKEESEISKPILLELNQSRKNIPLQEQAIEDIINATPEVGALDYIADVTGFEPLRSSSGAKLKTAIKDFFLSDLTRAGARPNQWIEQQLADALPKIGRSENANLITAEGMKFKVDLAKKRIETIDRLVEEDRKKFGYVKGDVDSRASKDMKKYIVDRQKELKENIEKIKSKKENQKKQLRMKSPTGEVWEIQPEDLEEAKENGYELIK